MEKGIIAVCFILACIIIEGCGTQSGSAKINLIQSKYSFGDVKRSNILSHKFAFINESSDPLFILNAKGSCECTSIKWPANSIVQGDTGHIEIQFVPETIGFNSKTIVVESNTVPAFTVLTIEANVLD